MRLSMLAIAAGTLLAGNAFAASSPTSGSFTVTASVANSCKVTSTSAIAFGAYDPADANFSDDLPGTGSVSVRCTKGTVANVALELGANPNGGSCAAPARRMRDGAQYLNYGIYQDPAHAIAWGCDAANDRTFTSLASNVPETLITHGLIPAGQDVAAGSFIDTVIVTVTF